MLHVPLYIEGLRSRPSLVFWLAALAQALVWLIVPMLFYAAPPAELSQVLAIGHEFPLQGNFGPPLAYWLAEIAFRVAGLFGVYALSQLCVIATYWCVFALGRHIAGAAHAAIAVLLMVGIFAFAVPTPNFGPPILAAPLWSAVLLFYWRAVGEKRPQDWYALAAAAALLLITSEAALILLGVLAAFTAMTERGRAAADRFDAWVAVAILVAMVCVHVLLLQRAGVVVTSALMRLRLAAAAGANATAWFRLLGAFVLAHAGLVLLAVLAFGWPRTRQMPAPAIVRATNSAFAATYVRTFAIMPALLVTVTTVFAGTGTPIGGIAPLRVLSGLAVVMAAGARIELHHQRILGLAWIGLLLVPAIFVPIVIAVLPWTTATDLKVAQPARAMGRFFADSFARRTGHPLTIVCGDARMAELVALAAPSRPSVYFDSEPRLSPTVTVENIREKGAVIVWPAADTDPAPPPEIKAHFPDLIPEVPQSFERPVRGRLPPMLVGWAVIRPANAAASAH
jgi:hypothetical protein